MSITYLEAIREAQAHALRDDPRVFIYGQDVGPFGGAFKATKNLAKEFPGRVLDSPISEDAMVGLAVGAAIEGLRPIIEMQFADFATVGFNQIVNQAATLFWRTQVPCPVTVRLPFGGTSGGGPFHSQCMEAIYAAGRPHGMTPYGTEAMHVLRAEKGYIIVGQDTDGTVTPDDAGLGWAIGKTKPDFVGKRSLERASMKSPDRKQLVGLRPRAAGVVLEEGAQVAAAAGQRPPMALIGHVTSSYASSVLGYSIDLALVAGGRARLGQTLYVPMPGGDIAVEVTTPVFYDPSGARING